jgi:hypothetical protein
VFELRQQQFEQHLSRETRGMTHVFPEAKGSRKNAATSAARNRFVEVNEMCTGFFSNPIKTRFLFQENL